MLRLNKADLPQLLSSWNIHFSVVAPTKHGDDIIFLPYAEKDFTMDYVNTLMPPKEYLFEQKESLFDWRVNGTVHISQKDPELQEHKILFGVRPCDVYGISYLDRFYIEEFRDSNYADQRDKIYIVAVNCIQPGKNCFCQSTGIGPFAERGYDLLFTPFEDTYFVESGSTKGDKLISLAGELMEQSGEHVLEEKDILLSIVEDKFTRAVNLNNVAKVMEETFSSPVWKDISSSCIGCTGCTNVCPTCTCFNVLEEQYCSTSGSRVRCWDSCQSDSFTRNAGNHNPRNDISRVRYRVYDKLKYIEERFNYKGCTGCGRCIEVCPSLVDIIDIVGKLKNEYKSTIELKQKKQHTKTFEKGKQEQHERCEQVYTPQIAIIKEIIDETKDIKRFIVQYEDKLLHYNYKFIGQFFEITIFGVGEIAISIPFGPSQRECFDFCVKKAGRVTQAMHELGVGDKIGLRGPFGKGFPYESFKGRDMLIIGSGVGIAPVRTIIVRLLENRQDFGKIAIMASATTYEGLIYKEDLKNWSEIEGVQVFYALSKPTDKLDAHVGYINDLLPDLKMDWKNTTTIICATPKRIKALAKDLMELGMKGEDILTSLETHMRCGIGKCGHCKVGNKYMCVDGPVFNYNEMLELPPEF